jgi:hypothetical protein
VGFIGYKLEESIVSYVSVCTGFLYMYVIQNGDSHIFMQVS